MIVSPSLPDEVRRLITLRGLRILDTAPEERFDRLTRLARRLFNVPIALITLVDHDRQWFKSSAGLAAIQTSRDVSFCGHAIASEITLLVHDAQLDRRSHDNPFVTGDPHVRFYAGCPLSMPNGSRIGTLCLIDSKPREFSNEDNVLLNDLTRMVEQEFRTEQLTGLDDLTGLPNRQAFMALAQHALNQCCRQKSPASVLFLDLTGFKIINDSYGHGEGDDALTAFATLLKDTVQNSDVVGRIGGVEFAVLLLNCPEANAALVSQRLQARLDTYNHIAARGYDIRFDASLVTADTSRRCVVEALLAEADFHMYDCKRSKAVMRFVA